MKKIHLIVLALTLLDCSSNQEKENKSVERNPNENAYPVIFTTIGDSLQLPPFEIQIDLDEKAAHEIENRNETIIVSAHLFGTPKDSVDSDLLTELGELYLATPAIELGKPGVAKFDNIHISKAGYDALADKDFIVLINVYSGRKSSKDNLLNCEILQEPISKVAKKSHALKGKLIHE